MTSLQEILEQVSGLDEFNSVSEYMQDEVLDECLLNVVKLIAKIDSLTPMTASKLIVQMSAMSFAFKIKGKNYMVIDKDSDPGGKKKNVYLSASESLDRLVDSIKYLAKT